MASFDKSGDSRFWPDTETLRYFAKTGEAPPASGVEVEGTLWLMIKKASLPPDSPLAGMDLTVEIPGRIVGPLRIVPKRDDIIQRANGSRWRIMIVEEPAGVDFRVHVVRGTK